MYRTDGMTKVFANTTGLRLILCRGEKGAQADLHLQLRRKSFSWMRRQAIKEPDPYTLRNKSVSSTSTTEGIKAERSLLHRIHSTSKFPNAHNKSFILARHDDSGD
jgi:hypothetical protein